LFKADDLKPILDEIRKLKAVIVKHENRIRYLEAELKKRERDEENNITSTQAPTTTTSDQPDSGVSNNYKSLNLAPDEV
jgi:coronin-1B/1C/6